MSTLMKLKIGTRIFTGFGATLALLVRLPQVSQVTHTATL